MVEALGGSVSHRVNLSAIENIVELVHSNIFSVKQAFIGKVDQSFFVSCHERRFQRHP